MRQAESSRDTVQRRKNSCLRDAFVFLLWHTSRHQPYGGSDKPPASVSATQPSPGLTQCKRPRLSLLHLVKCLQQRYLLLPHPARCSHILSGLNKSATSPRAARQSCRSLLTQITRKFIDDPNDQLAWTELLHFGPVILAKRGGANRNLSNIVIKRTAAWGKDPLPVIQEQRTHTIDQAKSP